MAGASLKNSLSAMTAPVSLGRTEKGGKVRCLACGHRCLIPPGHSGVCKVRFNREGRLFGPWGYVAGLQDDPIEKKPFYHALPGTRALSFGMLGCDFHCGYCQNWVTSQALRDEAAGGSFSPISAEEIVVRARERGALTLTSTYNEPLITAEWAAEIFRLGKNAGLKTSFVSNGNNTDEVIDLLKPLVDFYNVDLKSFDDRNYRKLGGTLNQVLEGIERVFRAGFWIELITLVVPDFNDSDAELASMANFIAEISPDIPWHVTAFHPDYRMRDREWTPPQSLHRAYQIGKQAGLQFVYPGNLAGQLADLENTRCPHCDALLVERHGFAVRGYHLKEGVCPRCEAKIPGRWHTIETRPNFQSSERGWVKSLRT